VATERAGGESRALFICAHGAGGHRDDRAMVASAAALAALGVEVHRFNFPYRERGAKLPDPMPVLCKRFAAEADGARPELHGRPLILGGRSMGGRVATMLAADSFACDALLLFAYPLHPQGKPEKLRDAHLPRIHVPVLCFNGTRDALCTEELMERALEPVGANWRQHWIEGADHSLKGAKVMDEMTSAIADWLPALKHTA
jgi:predicted alpha/beta-hydrolase family hydrolase